MPERLERAMRYRTRAEELRAIADYRMHYKIKNKGNMATLVSLARQYDKIAEHLERVAKLDALSPP
jgi:hypothetical protein